MPLTDYINLNPAPEATGGYYTGGLGLTADEMANAANAISFYNQANTMGVTPFESQQLWNAANDPTKVYISGTPGVQTEASGLTALNLLSPSQSSLPANIFSGPIPSLGLAGAGANALYNLGTAGYNYLTGQGNMPLSSMTGGNLGLAGGDLGMSSTGIPSNLSLATGVISQDPAIAQQQAMANAAWNASIGTPGWTPTVGQSQTVIPATGTTTLTSPEYTLPTVDVSGSQVGGNVFGMGGYASPGTQVGGLDLGVVGAGAAITPAAGMTVSGSTLPATANTAQSSTYRTVNIDTVNTSAPVVLPTFTAGANSLTPSTTSSQPATTYTQLSNTDTGTPSILPTYTVNTQRTQTSATSVPSSTYTQSYNLTSNTFTPTSTFTGTSATQTSSTGNLSTYTGSVNTGDSFTGTSGGTNTSTASPFTMPTQRDFQAELQKSLAALQANQQGLMGMYGGIYQNLLGQTAIPQAAQQSLAQMQADAAKLQRIQQGYLGAEDVRNATQQAREAYAARGQVMGPGAIGAEILNREAIRQQRENEARQAYQASMGNVFNAAQLQTGNIFSPIGNLVGSTFNPLGAYPQDVYSSNVNAQLARDISAANNAAAIEAAKYGAAAQQKAATTAGLFNVGTNVAKWLISCMPGWQTIDTPNGPVAVAALRAGDVVVGYDGAPAVIMQHSSYVQDPTRLFIRFTMEDGSTLTVCDVHQINGIPAKEWAVGAMVNGKRIAAMEPVYGITTSYDILTTDKGYRINGVGVNSMIPEMMKLFKQVTKEIA